MSEASKRHAITPREEALVALYFRGHGFDKSTAGPMFERARRIGYDSDEHRLASPHKNWAFLMRAKKTPGTKESFDWLDIEPQIFVKGVKSEGEPSYEVDESKLLRFSTASRVMLAVERVSPLAKATLEAYYGDRGSRFAVFSSDRLDPETRRDISGAGPGSIAAVYILTEEGQRLLENERRRDGFEIVDGGKSKAKRRQSLDLATKRSTIESAIRKTDSLLGEALKTNNDERIEAIKGRRDDLRSDLGMLPAPEPSTASPSLRVDEHMTDDTLLETVFSIQKTQPNQARGARLDAVEKVARKQLEYAQLVWLEVRDTRRVGGSK